MTGLDQIKKILKNWKHNKCECGNIISHKIEKCEECFLEEWGRIVEQSPISSPRKPVGCM